VSKINQILQKWPPGTVITTDWLERNGVSRQLVDSYKKSGWLEQIQPGAYKRPNDSVNWPGGVYALQKLQQLPVHVGGITSLEELGFGHYIKRGDQLKVVLWKTPEDRLPSWFQNHEWNANLKVRSVNLFEKGVGALTEKKISGVEVTLSTAERAILEYLYDVPKFESFDEAAYIMEGMVTLRPSLVQELLERCQSIRVKRIFLYMAESNDFPWFRRLDKADIELGRGKREIIKGGKLNKTYQIVVPEIRREDR